MNPFNGLAALPSRPTTRNRRRPACTHGVAYEMLNKPDEALRNLQEALAIRRRIGQKRGMAVSLNEMAKAQALLGKTKTALANLHEALHPARDWRQARSGRHLAGFGQFLRRQGDHDQALEASTKKSLQIEREIGNEGMQAICLNNIGNARIRKGRI